MKYNLSAWKYPLNAYLTYLTQCGSQAPEMSFLLSGQTPYSCNLSPGIFSKDIGRNAALTKLEKYLIVDDIIS